VWASVGLHPHSAVDAAKEGYTLFRELAATPEVVGFGEIGLDYVKEYSPRPVQRQEFERQMELANDLQLPVIIHDREAHQDTLAVLRHNAPLQTGGVMHCFSGDTALAEAVIDLGMYISIPGIVTFKNATVLQEVVANIDLKHMLIESDGPFLAPTPFRGKRNLPQYVGYTAAAIAAIKGTSMREVARQTTDNFRDLFQVE
jgi:TatD DNase family protein